MFLIEGEDSAESLESSEFNSSEETETHVEPSQDPLQPAFTEADLPNAIGETDPVDTVAPLPSADSGPSLTTLNTSAIPEPEDPQTSTDTDALQLMPDDPSQTAMGTGILLDMPDLAQDTITIDTVHVLSDTEISLHSGRTKPDIIIGTGGATQPQVTTTKNQGFLQGSTLPFSPHIKPTLPPFSITPPLPILGTSLIDVPVCFPFQFETPEPEPPRGDSI